MSKKKDKVNETKETVNPLLEPPKWKKVVKIAIPAALCLFLVILLLVIAFGEPDTIKFSKDGIVKSDVSAPDTSKGIKGQVMSDAGMTMFADNGILELGYSPKDDLFIVIDKASGTVFRSYPEPIYEGQVDENGNEIESDLATYSLKTEAGQILRSPVFIGYTKSGMEGGFVKGINQMNDVVKSVYYIENGVQLVYEIGDLQLEFTVEITLDGSSLKYRIPGNGIIERPTVENEEPDRRPLLASLAVLPYFGAHRSGDNGFFVTPDGSGSLTYFDVARVSNYNEYAKKIYGIDNTFDSLDAPDYSNESLLMAAYGIVDDNYMMTGFIDQGEVNAKLMMGNPGVKNLPFYSVYFQYVYRYFYQMQISKSGSQYSMVVKDMQMGDVEQHIYIKVDSEFSEEDKTEEKKTAYSYTDVALQTRDLILAKWSDKWGVTKSPLEESNSVMNVKFFMGAKTTSGGLLNQMKVMTDFDDVKSIYNDLAASGADDLRLTLLGWTKGGYYWNSTTKNKVDNEFGGKKGLESLNKWASKKGIELTLDNNLLIIYGSPKGLGRSLRNTVVKKPNTFYLNYYSAMTNGRFRNLGYLMSPKFYNSELLNDNISRLKSYGTKNVSLQQVGDILYTDYNEQNPLLRLQTQKLYVSWIEKYQSKFDNVSVYYGYDYAAAVADTIDDIPMNTSRHILMDESIPFVQMVYHGLIDYYSAPLNNQDSFRTALLKSIEYGANISFEVTKEEARTLRYTNYVFLFKAEYGLIKDEMVEAYNEAQKAIKPFATQQIVSHSRVGSADVFCTEYSGGAKVYTNYTDADYTLPDGSVVASMNYLIVNG